MPTYFNGNKKNRLNILCNRNPYIEIVAGFVFFCFFLYLYYLLLVVQNLIQIPNMNGYYYKKLKLEFLYNEGFKVDENFLRWDTFKYLIHR